MKKEIGMYGKYKIWVLSLFVVFACMMNMTTSESCAGVMSADDTVFGIGALTRDTDQMLDFLDVTRSTSRSVVDVSGELGAGGDFEGFRYATLAEWTGLIDKRRHE